MRTQVPPSVLIDDSVAALLRRHADSLPMDDAVLAPDRAALTYHALWRQVQEVTAALAAFGVARGERVGVALPNGPEMAVAFLGVAAWTACAPLNPALRAAELRFLLDDARIRLVLVPAGERGPVYVVARQLGLAVVEIESQPTLPAGSIRIRAPSNALKSNTVLAAACDVALVLHTSGTTGRAKLVPLSHAKLLASANNIAQHLGLRPSDRCLNVMPLFHIHGLVGALLASLASGGSVACAPAFDSQAFFDWVGDLQPTWYTAVPTIHQAVIAQAAQYRQKAPNHRFRFVRSSSAALPRSVYSALKTVFDAPVVEAYGMTEASHQMASNPVSAGAQRPGSVGVPAGVEIAVVDGNAERVPAGGTGEIVIRGSGVFDGYENNPDADAHAFVDGWFRTGDLGHFDSDGYLYVSGRISEVINRGGEKIAPREIEEALLDYPEVVQAVAFARAHATLGQDVAAAVVLRPGSILRESALRGFLFNRIAVFKIPSTIVVVDAIPIGPTGKFARTNLEQELDHLIAKSNASPRTAIERLVEAAFREVLGCAPVGADDNFFALGGDSLKGAQVMARVNTQCGTDLSPATLFRCPSVAALAAAIEAAEHAADAFERDLAEEVAQMSDEEVARLLADEGSPTQ